jgi:hypothetical protein
MVRLWLKLEACFRAIQHYLQLLRSHPIRRTLAGGPTLDEVYKSKSCRLGMIEASGITERIPERRLHGIGVKRSFQKNISVRPSSARSQTITNRSPICGGQEGEIICGLGINRTFRSSLSDISLVNIKRTY